MTSRCNLDCAYCGFGKRNEELDTSHALSLISEMSRMGTKKLIFTGGEPLLRKDIHRLLYRAKSENLNVILNTNGILVPEKRDAVQKADFLSLSLDGPKKLNDEIRGSGSFEGVFESIKIAKEKDIKVGINSVITSRNVDYIGWLLDKSKEIGVPINFQPVVKYLSSNIYSENPAKADDLLLSRRELEEAIRKIIKFKISNPKLVRPSFRTLKMIPEIHYTERRINCGRGIISCRIERRELTPCSRAFDSERVSLEDGFKKAWERINEYSECTGKCCTGAIELSNIWNLKPLTILNQILNNPF